MLGAYLLCYILRVILKIYVLRFLLLYACIFITSIQIYICILKYKEISYLILWNFVGDVAHWCSLILNHKHNPEKLIHMVVLLVASVTYYEPRIGVKHLLAWPPRLINTIVDQITNPYVKSNNTTTPTWHEAQYMWPNSRSAHSLWPDVLICS